ncbi:MAG: LysR family transcriptional regulator [Hyphomicrobiaceae bacterium]
MVPFTLKQCAYLSAVAAEGGIAQAARALNVAQPSVAQAIDKLEAVTGLTLVERHHARGVTLTMAGRTFLERARSLLAAADEMAREARQIADGASGEIRLGAFPTIAAICLPGLVRSFATVRPAVRIQPVELALRPLAEAVRDSTLDLGLTYDIGDSLAGLARVRLASVVPRVVLAAGHPLAAAGPIDLADLASEPFVMFDAPGSREFYEGLIARAGRRPVIGYRSTTLEGVRSAVGAGFGYSIVALSPPSDTTYEGNRLAVVDIRDPNPLDIVLAVRETMAGDRAIVSFIEHAAAHLAASGLCSAETTALA